MEKPIHFWRLHAFDFKYSDYIFYIILKSVEFWERFGVSAATRKIKEVIEGKNPGYIYNSFKQRYPFSKIQLTKSKTKNIK